MDFQQSRTYINLQEALRYQLESNTAFELFEMQSDEEILIPISFILDTAARNSRFIANRLRSLLYGETTTLDNLKEASAMENAEIALYREYSQTAREEGYSDIASLFNGIANILLNHSLAFDNVAADLENGQLYCKQNESLWVCLGCGNILSGECAPDVCPICAVPGSFYQILMLSE
jgi:rubrerythrin